jgi:hypothetical protein
MPEDACFSRRRWIWGWSRSYRELGCAYGKATKGQPRATLTVKSAPQPDSRTSEAEAPGEQPEVRHVSKNGYAYEIDQIGRTRRVSGTITLNPKQGISRANQRDAGGPDRKPHSDQGGQYIARQFNGPTEAFNHFAQNSNFNQSRYAKWKISGKR